LQLAKMCARHHIVVCASGATPRVDWILRAHACAYAADDEQAAKDKLEHQFTDAREEGPDKIFLFDTLYEALEYCESMLISELQPAAPNGGSSSPNHLVAPNSVRQETMSLSTAFVNLLGLKRDDTVMLEAFERKEEPFHVENEYHSGEAIFQQGIEADAFFVVLSGSVAVFRGERVSSNTNILSGAGNVRAAKSRRGASDLGEVSVFLPPGSVFGFVGYILESEWTFSAVCAKDHTMVARLHRSGLKRLQQESPELQHIVDKVLLKAAILELSNVREP
jgi:CRP-like cAMP-binding protein